MGNGESPKQGTRVSRETLSFQGTWRVWWWWWRLWWPPPCCRIPTKPRASRRASAPPSPWRPLDQTSGGWATQGLGVKGDQDADLCGGSILKHPNFCITSFGSLLFFRGSEVELVVSAHSAQTCPGHRTKSLFSHKGGCATPRPNGKMVFEPSLCLCVRAKLMHAA